MDRREFLKTLPAFAALSGTAASLAGEAPGAAPVPTPAPAPVPNLPPIELPRPETEGGKSVLAALKERRTVRNIKPDNLPRRCCRTSSGRPSA